MCFVDECPSQDQNQSQKPSGNTGKPEEEKKNPKRLDLVIDPDDTDVREEADRILHERLKGMEEEAKKPPVRFRI